MPTGPISSPILLVGEFPGHEEIITGIPFVGKTGEILQSELARLGLSMCDYRITNMWLHKPNKPKHEDCDVNWHLTQMAKEINGRKLVLLMGSDLTKALFNKSVTDIMGLKMECDRFPGIPMIISVNPAQAMHGPLGEFRLSLSRFQKEIEHIH